MAERYIPEHRRTQFKAKNTFKPDELRRRREEQQVEIRKQKREENLAKRRGLATGADRPGASLGAAPDSDDDTAPTESQVSSFDFFIGFSPSRARFPGYCLSLSDHMPPVVAIVVFIDVGDHFHTAEPHMDMLLHSLSDDIACEA